MSTSPVRAKALEPADPYLIRIRDMIYKVAGIFHPDTRLPLLADRCERRMKELKVATCREYLGLLTFQTAGGEIDKLLNEITIGETRFFRNQPQLDALKAIVWPKIIAASANALPKRLRIWSAGCSTGEEPYTLAMMLLEESSRMLKGWSFEIMATDLNERSLAHAGVALYDEYSVRKVPALFRTKYFLVTRGLLQVSPLVRKLVTFSRLNLRDERAMSRMRDIDLIFCANVLIYFDVESKRKVIDHFFRNLRPHGYLFLGHSESLYGVNEEFRLVHFPGATGYAKSRPQVAEGGRP
jgi:chemotaxis protein methyltransferase CheR